MPLEDPTPAKAGKARRALLQLADDVKSASN